MTDHDDGIIRLSPTAGTIDIAIFDAHTTAGVIATPMLVFEDERFGPVHILLNPVDQAAVRLTDKMVSYVKMLVEQAEQGQETDQDGTQ